MKETNVPCRKFQIIHTDTLPVMRWWSVTPQSLRGRGAQWVLSKERSRERWVWPGEGVWWGRVCGGGGGTVTAEKPDRRYSNQAAAAVANISGGKSCRPRVFLARCDENGTLLLWSSAPNPQPRLITRKASDLSQLRDMWPTLLHQKQGTSEKRSQLRGAERHDGRWNVATWVECWDRERKLDRSWKSK